MTLKLDIPTATDQTQTINLETGEIMFVLGANGTGKSSLMFYINTQAGTKSKKISAHRQNWMNSDTLDMTSQVKLQTEQNIQNIDRQLYSRYRDDYGPARASMTIYELIDTENVLARRLAELVRNGDLEFAVSEADCQNSPISIINELLQSSNLPITIRIHSDERLMASKNGGPEYSAAQLSDGERNALLIAGNVLTAKPETLLIIDEPERHLHRSIISPLLSQLFRIRSDCTFIVSTHDHSLPLEFPSARTLYYVTVRSTVSE